MTFTRSVQILLICLLVGLLAGGAAIRASYRYGFEHGLKLAAEMTGTVCKTEGYAGWRYDLNVDDPAATARCMTAAEMEKITDTEP